MSKDFNGASEELLKRVAPQSSSDLSALPELPPGTWRIKPRGIRGGWPAVWRVICVGLAAVTMAWLVHGDGFKSGEEMSKPPSPLSSDTHQGRVAVVSNDVGQNHPIVNDSVSPEYVASLSPSLHPPPIQTRGEQDHLAASNAPAKHAAKTTELTKPPGPSIDRAQVEEKEKEKVMRTVDAWRAAWQAQWILGYLAQYTETFQPVNGQSHDAWVSARQAKLAQPKNISIRLHNIKLQRLDDQRWVVRFRQTYESDTYQDIVTKELTLIKSDKLYLIEKEQIL